VFVALPGRTRTASSGSAATTLRHSRAGLLFAAGTPLSKVAAVLRHSDTRVTAEVSAGLVESDRADLADDFEAAFAPTMPPNVA